MPNDQELQQAYRRLLNSCGREDRAACVSPEAILSLVEGAEDEETRLRTLDHVMACPPCREDFELLRGLARSRTRERKKARSPFAWDPRKLAWAASVVLFIGAGSIWWGIGDRRPAGVMRGDGAGLVLISPEPGAGASEGMTFSWHSVDGAFEYTVEILDEDGALVYEATTSDTTISARGPFPGGQANGLSWWVTARTTEGGDVRSDLRPLGPPER